MSENEIDERRGGHPVWLVRDARNPSLTFGHKAILFALASRMTSVDDRPWPSIDTVAADAGGGTSQTKVLLGELVAWTVIDRGQAEKASGRRNAYGINFEVLARVEPFAEQARRQRPAPKIALADQPERRPIEQPEDHPINQPERRPIVDRSAGAPSHLSDGAPADLSDGGASHLSDGAPATKISEEDPRRSPPKKSQEEPGALGPVSAPPGLPPVIQPPPGESWLELIQRLSDAGNAYATGVLEQINARGRVLVSPDQRRVLLKINAEAVSVRDRAGTRPGVRGGQLPRVQRDPAGNFDAEAARRHVPEFHITEEHAKGF